MSVHVSPSGPCPTWNVCLSMKNRLVEESEEESGTKEESSLLMGERAGGPGVGSLCPEQGRGTGMAMERFGGVEVECTWLGKGSPFPPQVQQRES